MSKRPIKTKDARISRFFASHTKMVANAIDAAEGDDKMLTLIFAEMTLCLSSTIAALSDGDRYILEGLIKEAQDRIGVHARETARMFEHGGILN